MINLERKKFKKKMGAKSPKHMPKIGKKYKYIRGINSEGKQVVHVISSTPAKKYGRTQGITGKSGQFLFK